VSVIRILTAAQRINPWRVVLFSLLKKPKRLIETDKIISSCIRKLIIHRLENDPHTKSELISRGGEPELNKEIVETLSSETLSSTMEYYIIYLIAVFVRLNKMSGKNYSYKDIVYTIDQQLPKPSGHIPVEMWSPENYSEYIKFRLTIDFDGSSYPMFVIDDLYEDTYATLKYLLPYYDEPFRY
jgi:hypothetical protein